MPKSDLFPSYLNLTTEIQINRPKSTGISVKHPYLNVKNIIWINLANCDLNTLGSRVVKLIM